MSANKIQTHPIAKIQAVFAILWGITLFLGLKVDGLTKEVWSLIDLFCFIALGGITFYIGWLMVVKKEVVLYPHEVFLIRQARRRNRQKRAYHLQKHAFSDKRRVGRGWMNLFSGFLCFIVGMLILFSG